MERTGAKRGNGACQLFGRVVPDGDALVDGTQTVGFTADFYLDTVPVTQADFSAMMGFNPAAFSGDNRRPVERVTWFDAVFYCNERSSRDGFDTVYSYTVKVRHPEQPDHVIDLQGLAVDLSAGGVPVAGGQRQIPA